MKTEKKAAKIKRSFLHQAITWNGVGTEKTLSTERIPGLKIRYVTPETDALPEGLLLTVAGKDPCHVPIANVANSIFETFE